MKPTDIPETIGLACHASLIPCIIFMYAFAYFLVLSHDMYMLLMSIFLAPVLCLYYVISFPMHYVSIFVHRLCRVMHLWLRSCTCSCLCFVHVYAHTYVTLWYVMHILFLESALLSFSLILVTGCGITNFHGSSVNGISGRLTGT